MRSLKNIKILFYPDMIREGAKVYDFCKTLGIATTNDINEEGITDVFFNHPNPKCVYPHDDTIKQLALRYKVYNLYCNDVRKSHVAKIHNEIFGYNASVGKAFKGKIVKKSNYQYKRNEKIVDKYSHASHLHFMKFIDTYKNGRYSNIRLPYYDGAMPCAVEIRKKDPFDRKTIKELIVKKSRHWLSEEELKNVRRFCVAMGLNYGELDILRHKGNKLIYVIDVNDKPGMGIMTHNHVIKSRFTQAFKQMILR